MQYTSHVDSRNVRIRLTSTLVTRKPPKICKSTKNAQLREHRKNVQGTKNEKSAIEWHDTIRNRICLDKLVIGGLITAAV